MRRAVLSIALILLAFISAASQTSQIPSPMVDHTRPHPRITRTETPGRRVDLKSLNGAKLFVPPRLNPDRPAPLLIHFHGASWLVEQHIARYLPRFALITVNLGAGSGAYRKPFEQAELFQTLLREASEALHLKRGWSSITLTGFSAGYGAVREILRRPENFAVVNNVLLLDGMHASYVEKRVQAGTQSEIKTIAEAGAIQAADVDAFLNFAREAVAGRKTFVVAHSEIFPGTYASTTECADYLLSQLNLHRHPQLRPWRLGMQQLSTVDARGFHLRGYAGNSAPDHIDFLHAMPAWFGLLLGSRWSSSR
jgi:hypothetical protein